MGFFSNLFGLNWVEIARNDIERDTLYGGYCSHYGNQKIKFNNSDFPAAADLPDDYYHYMAVTYQHKEDGRIKHEVCRKPEY